MRRGERRARRNEVGQMDRAARGPECAARDVTRDKDVRRRAKRTRRDVGKGVVRMFGQQDAHRMPPQGERERCPSCRECASLAQRVDFMVQWPSVNGTYFDAAANNHPFWPLNFA